MNMIPLVPPNGNCCSKRDGGLAQAATRTNPSHLKTMKKLNLLIMALFASALLQGCGNQGSATADGSTKKRLHLAFVANSPGEYWTVVNLGCDIAAQQLGNVDVDFRFPAEATTEAQQAIVTKLVASGVDGIAISPIDADKQVDFLKNVASKTLLVCADSDAAASQRAGYVGTDNVAAGVQAADLIKAALPEGGKIALFVGYAKAENTKDRIQGIRNGLAGSNIQIIETMEDGQNSTVAGKNVADAMTQYPDLAGMVGISGYHGPAILSALKQAGMVGKVKIVCFDDNSDTLAGIAAGDIYGTIAQNPFQIGKQAIISMEKYLGGDQKLFAGTNIFTSSRPLTKDNVANYIAEQKNISFYLKDKKD
jgi:ribose transport system substrate-binding protein